EVTGRREAKFAQLAELGLEDPQWRPVRTGWDAPFTPAATSGWDDYPALSDLLPWVAPGIKPNRTWVYAPAPAVLKDRWTQLITEQDPDRKRELLKVTRDRDITTHTDPLPGGTPSVNAIAT